MAFECLIGVIKVNVEKSSTQQDLWNINFIEKQLSIAVLVCEINGEKPLESIFRAPFFQCCLHGFSQAHIFNDHLNFLHRGNNTKLMLLFGDMQL